MTTSQFPERPNLEQLKKQAKGLLKSAHSQDPGVRLANRTRFRVIPALAQKTESELAALHLALHDAQSVVARERGFPSWNALRERVELVNLKFDEAAEALVRSATCPQLPRARQLLALVPSLARANFWTALVTGEAAAVHDALGKNPALATTPGGPHRLAPIHYVAHSRFATIPGAPYAAGLLDIARELLTRGADANAYYIEQGAKLPVLWGATCEAPHPALAQLLLTAGANPNDGESLYHAAERGDTVMLDLLAAHGAQTDGGAGAEPWDNTPLCFILGHYAGLAHDADVRRGAAWLLARGANPNHVCYRKKSAETPLHVAARHWDAAMIELLVAHGADLHTRRADGRTALTLAELNGRTSAAGALRAHGAVAELSLEEKFIAACMRGDREEALQLRDPKFVAANSQQFLEAGEVAIETMLACGFDIATTGNMGETKLHWAAFTGSLPSTRLLLAHGASLTTRDKVHNAPPLGWCFYSSLNERGPRTDFPGVARALLEAGATLDEDQEAGAADDVLEVVAEFRRQRGATPS